MCITLLWRRSMWDRRGLDRKPWKADDGVVFAGRCVDTNVVVGGVGGVGVGGGGFVSCFFTDLSFDKGGGGDGVFCLFLY